MASQSSFDQQVFINCPFDDDYTPLLRPLLFTVIFLGYTPRIASERFDSGENRIDKIGVLMRESRYSIHDLSRLISTKIGEYQRMNMPFELGIDYGLRLSGKPIFADKRFLIMEKGKHELKKALSDLAGVDIGSHKNEPDEVVRIVRNWFVQIVLPIEIPSPKVIWYEFTEFTSDFYDKRMEDGYSDEDLNMMPVPEYINFISQWIASR